MDHDASHDLKPTNRRRQVNWYPVECHWCHVHFLQGQLSEQQCVSHSQQNRTYPFFQYLHSRPNHLGHLLNQRWTQQIEINTELSKIQNSALLSRSSIFFNELTFTLDWAWSAEQPDHVTADAWPRFDSRTVSLSALAADSSSVVLNMLCGFLLFDVRSRTLHTYFVFFL